MKLGVHVSISGDLKKAAERAERIGCESFQIFTSNPRGWNFKIRQPEEISAFKELSTQLNISPIFGHAIYLTNIASQNPYIYTNSINSLLSGMVFAKNASLAGVITHIGSHGGAGEKEGTAKVVNAVSQILETTKDDDTKLILETDAGSGNHLGGNFQQIVEIIKQVQSNRLNVCLDTCHIFAAGYDIRGKRINNVMDEFHNTIGLDRLAVLHLNDSKGELGSHLDRHEEIGKGAIGLETFEILVNKPEFKELAGIIETPDNKDSERTEELGLDILKKLRI